MARKQQVPWILCAVCALAAPLLLPPPLGATPPQPPPPESLTPPGGQPQTEVSTPFLGVRYVHELRQNPTTSLHIVTVDLTNPAVSLRVVPAGGPPGTAEGRWPTTLLSVPEVARREGFDLAVNGDYFEVDATDVPADGDLGALAARWYRKGRRARVMGAAATDGRAWATSPAGNTGQGHVTLMVDEQGRARIDRVMAVPAGVRQALSGGNMYLVEDGRPADFGGTERNALTAVGLDREGKTLTIVVADGLWDRRACGITMPEMRQEMVRLGCWRAFNLDGGGSSTLVMREAEGGAFRTLNHPTDGKARPVAEALGICVKRDGGK